MTENIEETKEIDLTEKVSQLEEQIKSEKEKYLYLAAEFDNYKKRSLKEKQDIAFYTKDNIIKDFLSVIDDVERSITNTKNSEDINIIKEGNNIIYDKFVNFLTKNGVIEINAINSDFNSDFHEAITTIDVQDEQKNKVIDVIEKGYTSNNKVIRYAKVIVGK